jgi:biotin synthase
MLLQIVTRRREEISQVYNTPLLDLIFRAATVHRMYNDPRMVRPCCFLPD